jgi:hypothetical protein
MKERDARMSAVEMRQRDGAPIPLEDEGSIRRRRTMTEELLKAWTWRESARST